MTNACVAHDRLGLQGHLAYREQPIWAVRLLFLRKVTRLTARVSFVITKLLGYTDRFHSTCAAILQAYPPVATTHHGVNFAKIAMTDGGRATIIRYVDAICSDEDG